MCRLTFLVLIVLTSLTPMEQTPKTAFKSYGGITVYDVPGRNVFIFTSGLMIDADGSPKAYHIENTKALDYLANAGKPGNWWALATDNKKTGGNPLIQSANDPAPGYYISMTSLQDGTKKYRDPNRYVNSETVPYIAIPPNFSPDFKLGDVALVINKKNNKRCYAIFADTGPKDKIGEGSIYLAEQLGIKNSPKNGGTTSDVTYLLFKNSGKRTVLSNPEIETTGKLKLDETGIYELIGQ